VKEAQNERTKTMKKTTKQNAPAQASGEDLLLAIQRAAIACAEERDALRAQNAALVKVVEHYMAEWNDTLAADFKDSPLDSLAVEARTALALSKGGGE
jgi:hypothetical protein